MEQKSLSEFGDSSHAQNTRSGTGFTYETNRSYENRVENPILDTQENSAPKNYDLLYTPGRALFSYETLVTYVGEAMAVLKEDYLTTLELLAGWDPVWDPEAVTVNRVRCMKRENLLQLIQDNVEAKTTVHQIVRQLIADGVLQPARLTSRMVDGAKVNMQVHEVIHAKIPAAVSNQK